MIPETLVNVQEFTSLASDVQVENTARLLEAHGIHTSVVETGEEARELVLSLIPRGAQVYNPPSRTIEQIGLTKDILDTTRFQPVRLRLQSLDRSTQRDEIRRLVTTPEVVVGSVHAITEKGEVMLASASGSQLSSAAAGAGKVIWVAGTQKLVKDLDEGFRRIREYCLLLEDERTHQAYGTASAINKLLIVNAEVPGRISLVLVKQKLGF